MLYWHLCYNLNESKMAVNFYLSDYIAIIMFYCLLFQFNTGSIYIDTHLNFKTMLAIVELGYYIKRPSAQVQLNVEMVTLFRHTRWGVVLSFSGVICVLWFHFIQAYIFFIFYF